MHRLEPRVKFAMLLCFSVFLVIRDTIEIHLLGLVIVLLATLLSKISILRVMNILKGMIIFVSFIFFVNLFFASGESIFNLWKITIYRDGLTMGAIYVLRLVLMVWAASLFGFTTRPVDITDSMEQSFEKWPAFRKPIRDFAMIILLAMRFIPSVFKDAERIQIAQKARGHRMKRNIFEKIKGLIPMIIPLFATSFKKADSIAIAMDLKGYNSENPRSFFKKWNISLIDIITLIFFVMFLLIPFAF